MRDIDKAKELLFGGGLTFAAVRGERVLTDTQRGVQPLLQILESEGEISGFSAADKVVGCAAAFLYVLLGVNELYADVISSHAISVLKKHGIKTEYSLEVTAIINRDKTGFCPMESAVLGIEEPPEALKIIKAKLAALKHAQ